MIWDVQMEIFLDTIIRPHLKIIALTLNVDKV